MGAGHKVYADAVEDILVLMKKNFCQNEPLAVRLSFFDSSRESGMAFLALGRFARPGRCGC
jgi:hypothetical protein